MGYSCAFCTIELTLSLIIFITLATSVTADTLVTSHTAFLIIFIILTSF